MVLQIISVILFILDAALTPERSSPQVTFIPGQFILLCCSAKGISVLLTPLYKG